MTRKRLKAPTPARVDASELHTMLAVCTSENTPTIPAAQLAFLARFGLDATRARLTAELAGWQL